MRQANLTLKQRDQALQKAAEDLMATNESLERLREEVTACAERPPDELCDRILARLATWCARPEDDISIVVMRFEGAEEERRC